MRRRIICAIGLMGALAGPLAGCRSAPPRYFTLDMRPSGQARPSRCALRVDRVDVAGALSRDNILIKMSPTEAEYYARDRWLAPLSDLVAEKLAAEFGEDGQAAEGKALLLVGIELRAFEQVDLPGGAEAHIKLDLSFRPSGSGRSDEPLFLKAYEARVPAEEARPQAVARALSQGLERVAAEIARDADRLAVAAGK